VVYDDIQYRVIKNPLRDLRVFVFFVVKIRNPKSGIRTCAEDRFSPA